MRYLQFATTVACLALLAGCATNRIGAEGIKHFYCGTDTQAGAYVPVRWSQRDTDETIAQNKSNNAVWSDTCRGRGVASSPRKSVGTGGGF